MVENIKGKLEEEYPGYKLIYLTEYGSKLFGLNHANSDTDYVGIFIPSEKDMLLKEDADFIDFSTNKEVGVKNSKEDLDIKLHSIYKFIKELLATGTEAVEVLFSMFREDTCLYKTKESLILEKEYKNLLTSNIERFAGLAISEVNKYNTKGERLIIIQNLYSKIKNLKYERIEDIKDVLLTIEGMSFVEKEEGEYLDVLNRFFVVRTKKEEFERKILSLINMFGARSRRIAEEGKPFKAVSQALRVIVEAEQYLKTGFIKFPLEEEKEKIMAVKLGTEKNVDAVIDEVYSRYAHIEELRDTTELPLRIGKEVKNEILYKILKEGIK